MWKRVVLRRLGERSRGLVVLGALAGAAHAGTTRTSPPVNVVVPPPAASALYPDDLPGPQAEVARDGKVVELPAIPAFELPAGEPGLHGPRELRVRGRALYGGELKVRGYVTWIYDCAAELARGNPNATRSEIEDAIDKRPALCDAPMFSLGDARGTARDASIWVVDVPSADHAPALAVGDHVVVTGTWAIESPRGERNASGLLVYRAVARAAPPASAAAAVAAPSGVPDVAVDGAVPLRAIVDTAIRNGSVAHLNACNRALAGKQYDLAITGCRAATDAWPDNHLAWYGWASAHLARGDWAQAIAPADRAVALRPDQGMYQLYAGMAHYEAAREHPAGELAIARGALLRAVRLEPALWRAHYYLGRVLRDLDDARRAAEQLAQAIALHPSYAPAYLALVELYRRWGYVDQAIAVATLGTSSVADASELWFELAMAYDAKRADDPAIDALGRALAARPDDAGSLLQRGQIYLRKNDTTRARRDLERVAGSTEPRAAIAKRLATELLAQLASRNLSPSAGGRPRYKQVYRPSDQPYKPWTLEDQKYRMGGF